MRATLLTSKLSMVRPCMVFPAIIEANATRRERFAVGLKIPHASTLLTLSLVMGRGGDAQWRSCEGYVGAAG